MKTSASRLATFAWIVLGVNILVILWGAVVRATGSGAGCGDHWPLCNGQVVPVAAPVETFVELFHRITSGVALIMVVILLISVFRSTPQGHPARTGASLSMVFILLESMVGAFIVLQRLTAGDTSTGRALVIALHQANTLLLIGALALTAWWASGGSRLSLRRRPGLAGLLGVIALGQIVLGATGAITALGDTLFPAASLAEGLQEKFDPSAHVLVRLRLLHPSIAIAMGVIVVALGWLIQRRAEADGLPRALASLLTSLFLAQLGLGALNVVLLAPVWMQLAHLLLADVVWITFVLLAASALAIEPIARTPGRVQLELSENLSP
jgi:heme A synthase